ncbi:MAG: cytochrome c oxidase accessory protein CcoG [Planctomycetes bacterium]|nr:cytochrome c oxidase accessory protein CcoG [Planctomycetota bacterium]
MGSTGITWRNFAWFREQTCVVVCPYGRFQSVLIAVFVALPFVTINGKPAMLLDIAHRQFTFFGLTLLATDTVLLVLFLIGSVLTVFLVTALAGRIWCGWACPQTVYMEFLYRPIERFFDGPPTRFGRPARTPAAWRIAAKYLVYLVASFLLANLFLAYFVGVSELSVWVRRSPLEHPTSFLIMASVTGLMLVNFAWFREQTCIVACPYGRLQSVLLDRHSLIIGYDTARGEPRRARTGATPLPLAEAGDCVDCGLCVVTCPTGIDIRNGLQLECVGCAQCIDACDAVMDKIKRPRGLIRYSSEAGFAAERSKLLRPRVILYPLILAALVTIFSVLLITKSPADITLLRGLGAPYTTLEGGEVANAFRLKICNRTDKPAAYRLEIVEPADARLTSVENPLEVAGGQQRTDGVMIVAPLAAFQSGKARARVRISDGGEFSQIVGCQLLGPTATGK